MKLPAQHLTATLGNSTPLNTARLIAETYEAQGGLHLIITPSIQSAHELQAALLFFQDTPNHPPKIYLFPDRETLPYDKFSPPEDLISERLAFLHQLPQLSEGILIAAISTLMHRLPPPGFLDAHRFSLKTGDLFDVILYRTKLEAAGYRAVKQVIAHGEFALRGAIFDVFPMGAKKPFRVDLFDNEIESIRLFDPITQRSHTKIEAFELLPAHEFPLTSSACAQFCEAFLHRFPHNTHSPVYQAVFNHHAIGGLEYYLPFFFNSPATLFDFCPQDLTLWRMPGIVAMADQYGKQILERYQLLYQDPDYPALLPELAFIPKEQLLMLCNQHTQIHLQREPIEKIGPQKWNIPGRLLTYPDKSYGLIKTLVEAPHNTLLILADSPGRAQILKEQCDTRGLQTQPVASWHAFKTRQPNHSRIWISIGQITGGFEDQDQHLIVLSEQQLFGRSALTPLQSPSQTRPLDAAGPIALQDLSELKPGDPIVHLEHGIGCYAGLSTLQLNGQSGDYLTLIYSGNDKLYVPIEDLNKLSPYTALNPHQVPLSQLGSEKWREAKAKALSRLHDVAAELLALYAKRALHTRPPFEAHLAEYMRFVEQFPYQETDDQAKAITDVLNDLASPHPMDRLLCGDVGFGKTEVALRAAFQVALNGHQVALLVPTTLLAQQHFETFQERFAPWPLRIALLSRFKTQKEQTLIQQQIQAGLIDIVIGTHSILSEKVQFKNLGLMVIDEEHRFGVRHKEQLKKLRSHIDILSMTATPIPRTLNMALSGLRDLSMLSTPPAKRLSVQTFVKEFHPDVIQEAILREIYRGGQVFFLHNAVESIESIKALLHKILPEVHCEIAHGQMPERQLERLMQDFTHNRFQVLISTTIIETGLDVQNANTIIMDRADKLGLAQMHQLRGRVGRSHHQAYAYLLTPPMDALASDAKKRLDAIVHADSLGAGFTLAQHDLEIRGAGELLGDEQSGQMQAIGYDLYLELLHKTIAALQKGESLDFEATLKSHTTQVDLGLSALLPESYIPDVHDRLKCYQALAQAQHHDALLDLKAQFIDRFGKLPPEALLLLDQGALRLDAAARGITQINGHRTAIKFTFGPHTRIHPATLISLIQKTPSRYKLLGPQTLQISGDFTEPRARLKEAFEVLEALG